MGKKRNKRNKSRRNPDGLQKGWGYVYVVNGTDRVRVGLSKEPEKRVKSVKSGAGLDRRAKYTVYGPLPNVADQERYVLSNIPHRIPGSEWFRLSYADVCRRVEGMLVSW